MGRGIPLVVSPRSRWWAVTCMALLVTACGTGGGSPATQPISTTAATPTVVPSEPATTTTEAPTTTLSPGLANLGKAPWEAPRLTLEGVPPILTEAWRTVTGRGTCSALYPQAVADLTPDATVRRADFGSDGWGVAWDLPSGPGRTASGSYCADCGRGAFGIAGTGVVASGDEIEIWPDELAWDDGSKAGYGYEGLADPSSGAPLLMYLLIEGEGCLYNVWSFLGEHHLLELVDRLRKVDGLEGEPTAWRNQSPPPGATTLGSPAWTTEPSLTADQIDRVYLLEWEGEANAPATCPLLAYADLGPQASGARIRRAANQGEMLVAWDRPSGPGHDGSGVLCTDCGRGAIGLGTFLQSTTIGEPITHRWSDGSEAAAHAGYYGTEMRLRPAGFDCTYWLWSHLGPDHLDYLLGQLRRVEGYP